ncbi:MAG: T9SS type A sorting domain-containing protein [Ignavibacteriota bacterium]
MLRIFFLLLILSFSSLSANAQWHYVGSPWGGGTEGMYQTSDGRVLVWAAGAVWVSSDWGKHWTFAGHFAYYPIHFGEDASGNIYACAEYDSFGNRKVWRSTDHGLQWSEFKLPFGAAYSIGGDRFGNIYAGVRNGMWKSADGGANWKYMNGSFVGDILDIRRSPYEDSTVWFYAQNRLQIWKITDSITTTFKAAIGSTGIVPKIAILPSGHVLVKAYDLQLSVDSGRTYKKLTPDSILQELWLLSGKNGEVYAASTSQYILRSSDEGIHWLPVVSPIFFGEGKTYPSQFYGLAGDGDNFVIATNDALYRSENALQNYFRSDTGFTNIATYSISFTPGERIVASSSFDGIWLGDADRNWHRGEMNENSTSYSGLFRRRNGEFLATSGYGNRLIRSTDDGQSWNRVQGDTTRYLSNIIEDTHGALFGAADGKGWCATSSDGGMSWRSINNAGGRVGTFGIPIACDSSGNVCYGGGYGTMLFYDRGGDLWRNPETKHTMQAIAGFEMAASPNGKFYFTCDSGIYRTSDLGKTWEVIKNIPTRRIRKIAVNADGIIFAGSRDSGIIYVSTDEGNSWKERSVGLRRELPITAIYPDNNGKVFVAILSRGIFYSSVKELGVTSQRVPSEDLSVGVVPNPFHRKTTITLSGTRSRPVTVEIFDALGLKRMVLVKNSIQDDDATLELDSGELPAGMYIVRMLCEGRVVSKKIILEK